AHHRLLGFRIGGVVRRGCSLFARGFRGFGGSLGGLGRLGGLLAGLGGLGGVYGGVPLRYCFGCFGGLGRRRHPFLRDARGRGLLIDGHVWVVTSQKWIWRTLGAPGFSV